MSRQAEVRLGWDGDRDGVRLKFLSMNTASLAGWLVKLLRVRLGWVRLGWVRLGQVRSGQVRLGWVRLAQIRVRVRGRSIRSGLGLSLGQTLAHITSGLGFRVRVTLAAHALGQGRCTATAEMPAPATSTVTPPSIPPALG